jgi:Ca2+-binding RTX toxin-like protein
MATPTSLETYFLQLINEARAKVGAKALTLDGELLDSSDAHSAWMDQTDTFSHTGVNGSSPGDRMEAAGYGAQGWGENIAYVSGGMTEATVQKLHTNLMNSTGHYANIVRSSFEEIGIGLKEGTINGYKVVFVTQNFGTPNSAERAETNDVGGTTTSPPLSPTPPLLTDPTASGGDIKGTSANNVLTGGSANDSIQGFGGNDWIEGRAGADVLTGGSGRDAFVFNTKLSAATNVDTITDFNVFADTIRLDNAVFTKLTQTGVLASKSFYKGVKAHDADDRIIYDSATGALSYDVDGTGASAAIKFTQLAKGLALTSNDFLVI